MSCRVTVSKRAAAGVPRQRRRDRTAVSPARDDQRSARLRTKGAARLTLVSPALQPSKAREGPTAKPRQGDDRRITARHRARGEPDTDCARWAPQGPPIGYVRQVASSGMATRHRPPTTARSGSERACWARGTRAHQQVLCPKRVHACILRPPGGSGHEESPALPTLFLWAIPDSNR
jgi:hypothetical protein